MTSICENIQQIKREIGNVELVVVSKYRSMSELNEVYECGHRDLGENRVQELSSKAAELPKDIRWHMIGHLQSNKVKYISEFIHLIHAVDSMKLLRKIDLEAQKHDRTIHFLFQIHIAEEESKYGLIPDKLQEILTSEDYIQLKNVKCLGLMGMATNTKNEAQIQLEFSQLKQLFKLHNPGNWTTLSMGMSNDYPLAIGEGSTCIRVGSKVFD
ncbi:MAG: YggS family pyridoxal phosphate-dependent enzyme [Bacteroidia bacterium]